MIATLAWLGEVIGMGQRRVRHDEAEASLGRLRAELAGVPAAARRSKMGAPSILEYLDQWGLRISRNDMSPDALPELYGRQALRYHRDEAVSGPLLAEERTLREARGEQARGYGAAWYFGRHHRDQDED